jgi:hypothetical protein
MPVQEIELADRQTQEALLARVDSLLDDSRATQERLARNFIEIGVALLEVNKTRAWSLRHHSSDAYVKSCEDRFGRSRNVLYGYRSVAENLLPHLPAEKLLEIGISKAQPLAQYVKKTGKKPSEALLLAAGNPEVGVQEFRAGIAEAQHEKPETGKWYDVGGFFCTPEEQEEIERGLLRAAEVEPLPEDCPDWLKRKIQVQRLVAEFLATYPCTEKG